MEAERLTPGDRADENYKSAIPPPIAHAFGGHGEKVNPVMRKALRLILGSSMLLAFVTSVIAVWRLGPGNPSAWATVAAALAVIAAVASAWTSQRVLEMQEDAREPNPVPVIDLRSRYQLAQFRIINRGGSSAHQVRIIWGRQLCDANGGDVLLGRDVAIPVIPEGENASVLLGASHSFMSRHADTTRSGTVEFENVTGRRYRKPFVVSAEHERISLVHDEEMPKTLRELQRLPDALEGIAQGIAGLARVMEQDISASPPNEGPQADG
jgi:hypothetical protein